MDQTRTKLTTEYVKCNASCSKIGKSFITISIPRMGSTYFLLCWHVLLPSPSTWLRWRLLLCLLSPPSTAPSCSVVSPPPSTPLVLCLPVFTAPPLPSSPSSVHFRCDLDFRCSDCPPPRLPLRVWWWRLDGLSSEPGLGIAVASRRTCELWWWCSPFWPLLLSVDSPRSNGGPAGSVLPTPQPAPTWPPWSWSLVCLCSSSTGSCWLKQRSGLFAVILLVLLLRFSWGSTTRGRSRWVFISGRTWREKFTCKKKKQRMQSVLELTESTSPTHKHKRQDRKNCHWHHLCTLITQV